MNPNFDPRTGRLLPGNKLSERPAEIRFLEKVRPTAVGCWYWTGAKDHGGYGTFQTARGRFQGAHRYAYEHFIGPIPTGLPLDHLCRNRACVNPTHLEPVTHAVNVGRSNSRRVSDELAVQILALRPPGPKRAAIGAGMGQVARRFGLGQTTVRRIWRGELVYIRELTA